MNIFDDIVQLRECINGIFSAFSASPMNLEEGTFKMARALALKKVLDKTLSKSDQDVFDSVRKRV